MFNLIGITDQQGRVIEADWLARAQTIHLQLRPILIDDYVRRMQAVFDEGGRMIVAAQGAFVVGVAVYRIHTNTFSGRQLYVDDLVTDSERRSEGVGSALLTRLEAIARSTACEVLCLDSGTQRHRAHRFYFREGMHISSFRFTKLLGP